MESLRLLLRENAPTLDEIPPALVDSIESSTGICKQDINTYIERVRRKVPFALREAYLSRTHRRQSPVKHCKTPEERRRNSTDGAMHFDLDPAESVHWNFPVPLTDGTGDMTLRNMAVTVDPSHEIMQFQFDADIRVQLHEAPLRLRKDSRCVDYRAESEMQTDSHSTVCVAVQTEMDEGSPSISACFSGRIKPHSSSDFALPPAVVPQYPVSLVCCILQ